MGISVGEKNLENKGFQEGRIGPPVSTDAKLWFKMSIRSIVFHEVNVVSNSVRNIYGVMGMKVQVE